MPVTQRARLRLSSRGLRSSHPAQRQTSPRRGGSQMSLARTSRSMPFHEPWNDVHSPLDEMRDDALISQTNGPFVDSASSNACERAHSERRASVAPASATATIRHRRN